MRRPEALAALLAGAGLAALAYGSTQGQVSFALVFIVPVIVGTGPWGFLGGLLLMAGVLAGFWAVATRGAVWERAGEPAPGRSEGEPPRGPPAEPAPRGSGRRATAGGFVLVGPIPLAFGTTRGLALAMLLLALLALALLLLLPRLLGGPA